MPVELNERELFQSVTVNVHIVQTPTWRVRKWFGLRLLRLAARLLCMPVEFHPIVPVYHETGGAQMVERAIFELRQRARDE